jgi:hypothetical protein
MCADWFFLGLFAGLGALSWLGWRDGHADFHPNYVRIYPAISPETNYYPTLDEMVSIVRARCRRDQILVIVGGNSILEGVWQPAADLWSAHLQELLGDRYCVVNLAFRGGSPTDGGAVVAEVLRKEFPRQILVANEAPFNGVESFAHEPYRYIFWQAYFRGRLMHDDARSQHISEYLWNTHQRAVFMESAASAWLDRALNYRDFWNRVCFEDFCTVPSILGDYIPKMLAPRRTFKDEEPDAYDPAFQSRKYAAASLEAEMSIVRGMTAQFYGKAPNGSWVLSWAVHRKMARMYREAFPAALIPRTLILLSQNSPYYRRRLTPQERERDELGYRDCVSLWRGAGYAAMEYGRDFTDDDFGDRTHLSKTGGRKLAEALAPEVRSLAQSLSYLQ